MDGHCPTTTLWTPLNQFLLLGASINPPLLQRFPGNFFRNCLDSSTVSFIFPKTFYSLFILLTQLCLLFIYSSSFKGDYNMIFYGDAGTLAAICHYVFALGLYNILLNRFIIELVMTNTIVSSFYDTPYVYYYYVIRPCLVLINF